MVSIAYGSNLNQPGVRFWLAGCPWVDPNAWGFESNGPPGAERRQQNLQFAGWERSQSFDLKNATVKWQFSSRVSLASYQAAAQLVATLNDAGTWQGVIEWWVPDADLPGNFNTYRTTGTVAAMPVQNGQGVTLSYTITCGTFAFYGSQVPQPDYLGDGLGNIIGDSNGAGGNPAPNNLAPSVNGMITDPTTWILAGIGSGGVLGTS